MNKKKSYRMMADLFKGKHFNNYVVAVAVPTNMGFFFPKYMDFS